MAMYLAMRKAALLCLVACKARSSIVETSLVLLLYKKNKAIGGHSQSLDDRSLMKSCVIKPLTLVASSDGREVKGLYQYTPA